MKHIFTIFLFLFFSILVFSEPFTLNEGHFDSVTDIVKYPFGNKAISVSNDETAIIWDLDKNIIIKTFELYQGALTTVAISPGGKYFAVGSSTGKVFIFDFNSKKLIASVKNHTGKVMDVTFGSKENIVISGGVDGNLVFYDINSLSRVNMISMPCKIISVTTSPNKQYIAIGGDNGSLYLIKSSDLKKIDTISNVHNDWITGIAFSPDNNYIASVSWDLKLCITSVKDLKVTNTIDVPADKNLNSVSWSSDNDLIAVASSDKYVYLYGANSLSLVDKIQTNDKQVYNAVFFPTSSTLLTSGGDAKVNLWDVKKRELLKSYTGY
ncbi:WD40 repeat domain-containing protein [Haliovirga abyssi]|uniref:Nucleoporin Nup159/Nup146 N-terminal domain-containing protein n=1 Tax=Haliovirga abyssi TaxID=2996794 RepID=A0AAU9DUD7_9FUSO|nr:hypothetical protein [Haliovirga abyssi]BDU49561.1 hypothetical protein HLVA_01300 [Haliovirga abyssi]